jgi:hypothetical protein
MYLILEEWFMDNILDRELNEEEEKVLRESLENWKEETYAQMMEEVETLKEQKIEELEEATISYKEELKEEFANKMITALNEMRDEIKAEVLAEMVESNPEIQVLEKIKEVVAPLLGEDYYANTYAESITTLQRKIDELEGDQELEEGAKTLAGLIAPFSEKTQNLILALIKEGNSEEVTDQFYTIVENLENVFGEAKDDEVGEGEMDTEEDDENEDEENEPKKGKGKKEGEEKKPKKSDFEDEEEYEKALKEWKKDQTKGEKNKEDEDEEDEETSESFIENGLSGLDEEIAKENSFRDDIRKNALI